MSYSVICYTCANNNNISRKITALRSESEKLSRLGHMSLILSGKHSHPKNGGDSLLRSGTTAKEIWVT